jgi:sulfite reductase (NADPH) flavoprotein alpha-component
MSNLAAGNVELPLDNGQSTRLQEAVSGLSATQLQWVSGYVAGLAASGVAANTPLAAADVAGEKLTILYGSQTGNGKAVAEALAEQAGAKGFAAKLVSLADYKSSSLKREALVSLVISTHGEGDPPDDAELFHEFLMSGKAPKLPGLRYSVFALGDSSYINFCETGRELDTRLAELGAQRLDTIVECDLDYEGGAALWVDSVIEKLPELLTAGSGTPRLHAVKTTAKYDKHHPFAAEVLVNQKITGVGSTKDVRHIELSIEGSGLTYEPGDSLAVVTDNPPQLVEQFLEELGLTADEPVIVFDENTTVGEALGSKLEITVPSLGFLRTWATVANTDELNGLLDADHHDELSDLIDTHQIIDIVRKYPASVTADLTANLFVSALRKLSPRSYSIASSQSANPDEVHLTVAAVRYSAFGSEHWGSASTLLADRLECGNTVSVFVEPNTRFRLPANPDTPVLMIGPGTGVAPFRAFVEERIEQSATGKNWLIFGDRHFSSDFLYQLEWQRYLKQGHLQQLDVAFSRDQQDKIYVQDRIASNAAQVYEWIKNGAVIYVCGDAKRMAGDVDNALLDVLVSQSGCSRDAANVQLKEMRRSGKYQRDVY